MTLQQLKYAIEIANCGSMNEAAKRLFISQPSLSNAIKELENELGIVIFERSNRGIVTSEAGIEFLGYARQVIEQMEFMESRYKGEQFRGVQFSMSTQHYPFVVDAYVRLLQTYDSEEYNLVLRETRTFDIIEDVRSLRSDIGVLYINEQNAKVMNKLFSDHHLKFTPLLNASPHIYVSSQHPLAVKEELTMEDVAPYPYLSFEQGEQHSLNFIEEIVRTVQPARSIKVSDRATLRDILLGTQGYTIGTGLLTSDLTGSELRSIPLLIEQAATIGWIAHKDIQLGDIAKRYIDILNDIVTEVQFNYNYWLL